MAEALLLWNNRLVARNNALSTGQECCCDCCDVCFNIQDFAVSELDLLDCQSGPSQEHPLSCRFGNSIILNVPTLIWIRDEEGNYIQYVSTNDVWEVRWLPRQRRWYAKPTLHFPREDGLTHPQYPEFYTDPKSTCEFGAWSCNAEGGFCNPNQSDVGAGEFTTVECWKPVRQYPQSTPWCQEIG